MIDIAQVSATTLRKAADLKERIEGLQDELNDLLGTPTAGHAKTTAHEGPKKRHVSAVAKARMAQAQRERWARIKGTKSAATPGAPKKKQMNEARLKALAKAREARWAKHRAANKGKKAVGSNGKPKVERSAAWRAAISAAAKARWAKAKAAGKTTL